MSHSFLFLNTIANIGFFYMIPNMFVEKLTFFIEWDPVSHKSGYFVNYILLSVK